MNTNTKTEPDTTNVRRQLRSGAVVLGGMGLLAAALTACSSDSGSGSGSDPDRRCVDRDSYNVAKGYRVVSDKNCGPGAAKTAKTAKNRKSGKVGKSVADGDWYYGGREKKGWVDLGSFTEPEDGSDGSSSYDDDDGGHHYGGGVHRGGFGGGHGSSGG